MMKRLSSGLLLAVWLAGLGNAQSAPQQYFLKILTINDVYEIEPQAKSGGMAGLMRLLQDERALGMESLTVVGGDFLSPSVMSSFFQGAQMVDLFNEIGVDAAVFGNHEFDFGVALLKQRMGESKFLWMGTNVRELNGDPLGTSKTALLLTRGGLKVGLLGLTLPETATSAKGGKDARFLPPVTAAQEAVRELKAQGADLIIALTHQFVVDDCRLAQEVPEITVIVGGHEHVPMTYFNRRDSGKCEPLTRPAMVPGIEEGTLILKAGSNAEALGVVELAIQKSLGPQGAFVRAWPFWRLQANFPGIGDSRIAQKVDGYVARMGLELDQPVGTLASEMDSRKQTVRLGESSFGNLVADAMRGALQADVALINGGALRGNRLYAPGTVLTRRHVVQELPLNNSLVLVELTGAQLIAALENGISQVDKWSGRFAQISGMRFTYSPGDEPGRWRIRLEIGGKPVDPDAKYRLATLDFLRDGQEGYSAIAAGRVLLDSAQGPLLSTVVSDYIASQGTIAPRIEGRIVAVPR